MPVPILSPCLCSINPPPPRSTLFPYTTLFRSAGERRRVFRAEHPRRPFEGVYVVFVGVVVSTGGIQVAAIVGRRSEEHTSELQSRRDLVCRLLLEKKNKYTMQHIHHCVSYVVV